MCEKIFGVRSSGLVRFGLVRTADECFLSTNGNRDNISPLSSSATLGNGGLFDGRIDKMRSVEWVNSDGFEDGFSGVDELEPVPLQYPVVSEFGIDSLLKITHKF